MSQEIATEILSRVKSEAQQFIPKPAIARFDASLQGVDKVIWLTSVEGGSHVRVRDGFAGGAAEVTIGKRQVLWPSKGSVNVYKNTLLGEVLIKQSHGLHFFGADVGQRSIAIRSKTVYHAILENLDAVQVKLRIGKSDVLSIQSLRQWRELQGGKNPSVQVDSEHEIEQRKGAEDVISEEQEEALRLAEEEELNRLIKEEEELRKAEEEELNRLIAEEEELKLSIAKQEQAISEGDFEMRLRELERSKERKEAIHAELAQIKLRTREFIRSQADLRTQHILDPSQESVKRGHFFDGRYLVIDGGPGTGKTTTLIQRIKFLISRSILDYLEKEGRILTREQESVLFSSDRPWIFISPSELLREYLARAMGDEGLSHLEDSVVDWQGHKRDLCRKYGIYRNAGLLEPLNPKSENFSDLYYYSDPARLRGLENALRTALLQTVSTRLRQIENLDFKSQDIQILLRNVRDNAMVGGYETLAKCIQCYALINQRYGERIAAMREQGQEVLRDWVRRKLRLLGQERAVESELQEIMDETADRSAAGWFERLSDAFEIIVRKKSAEAMGIQEQFTAREQRLLEAYPSLVAFDSVEESEKIAFAYVLATVGTGVNQNVFDEVIPVFRAFRKTEMYRTYVRARSHAILGLVLDKNRRLHPDEEAILLLFINRLMNDFRSVSFQLFRDMQQSRKHPFQIGFEAAIKAVIAVDEVTDFSLIDIDCITSLKHPVINSVTFCGDLMQRMTVSGIKDWSDLDSILSRRISTTGSYCDVIPLVNSYRQSQSVLAVARALYRDQQGRSAPFSSQSELSPFEPKPRLYVSSEEQSRITWVAEYIRSITEDYSDGVLPTIAVIVKNDEAVLALKDKLDYEPAIQECGIPVEACDQGRTIGRKSSVRIFSVEYIKGLEFESVIFHDIDTLQSSTNADLLGKFLYVGISRAAYHLALTSSTALPSNLHSIEDLLEESVES